jgi:nucleoside-diphosphate-sugar epimerase
MRVFVAGATGAIGRPLIPKLLEAGHEVTALARTPERARALEGQGVETALADAFDEAGVREAVVTARPEVLIHQLTALPHSMKSPRKYAEALAPTSRIREKTAPYFLAAAREAGARRVIFQSVSFIAAPQGPPVVDETAPVNDDPVARATANMERAVLDAEALEGIVLRYGFFYGPGTWYAPDGFMAELVRKRQLGVIGSGEGRSSFLHLDDAAAATVLALDRGRPGIYNITDDQPVAQREWVPELARLLDTPKPRHLPAWLVRLLAGRYFVIMGTELRGNSNAKARAELGFEPRFPHWREGFAVVFEGARAPARAAA